MDDLSKDWESAFNVVLRAADAQTAVLDAATDGLTSGFSTTGTIPVEHHHVTSWWAQLLMTHAPVPPKKSTGSTESLGVPPMHASCTSKPLQVISVCSGICSEAAALKVSWL